MLCASLQTYRAIQRFLMNYKEEKRGPTMILVQSPWGKKISYYGHNKSLQFSNVPHIGLLWYLDSKEILLKGK